MMLLKLALSNLQNAKYLYYKSKTEEYLSDANFNLACYNIQQALEHFIKFKIDYEGLDYVPKHELVPNIIIINTIEDSDIVAEIMKLESLFPTIDKWYTDSRYKDNFFATKETFEKVLNVCEFLSNKYSKYLNNLINEKENEEILNNSEIANNALKDVCNK